ncbi:MAG TPA: PIN domain-containing protein [Candidatus Binatia bacterium]|nr:PIN domain-containing protein [Candidatus Binatia bacterium]
MDKVFVDTAAWLALLNMDDALHAHARQVMSTLRRQRVSLVTTEFVLLEVADALSAPTQRARTVEFINGLRRMPILSIIPASQSLFMDSWTLYSNRLDKDWSLTDCSCFVVMTKEHIMQAFTSDHNFEQAGFIKLL